MRHRVPQPGHGRREIGSTEAESGAVKRLEGAEHETQPEGLRAALLQFQGGHGPADVEIVQSHTGDASLYSLT